MKGKEGVTLIFNSRITHETLINYYIPISFKGRIIGVLNGMYQEEQLREIISTDFFGMPAKTYLCKKDGTVISSSGTGQDPENLLDFLTNTPEEGNISFCLAEKPSRIEGSACYEFVIADDGIGMEKEFISQMMNGSIDVKSQLNQGTVFTVQIYLKLEEGSASLDRLIQTSYDGIRVLLVEDNELNTEIACELLSSAGIKVETADNGQKAVDAVKSHPAYYYSLIFMDIQMPVKNGYEAAREIRSIGREDLKQIPIIAMSADAFTDDVKRALDAGMNDHVAKPIELKKLLDALEKWTAR